MYILKKSISIVLVALSIQLCAQPDRIKSIFPEGTQFLQNIPYASDTLKKHLLDIYLPKDVKPNTPVVIWVHGGAWMLNDKYADMGYMSNTIRSILEKGYVLASIDYRHSTTAIFPAQIQDCYQALEFLHNNASKYKLDKNKFVLFGFSAGGHLASLLALSINNNVSEFYPQKKKTNFKIKAVMDFYGPSDFLSMTAMGDPEMKGDPISTLLGSTPIKRPDISKLASPSNYVDKDDPPFIIVHGEKDESVPYQQSVLLQSYLNLAGVKNQLIVVKGAPHFGAMFDTDEIRTKVLEFLALNFK
ncbi:MAG TPA: alpha/beta hydrolase [Chryseolinea sp.]|nr:alpha/beta hydrolase [Chryseolinea sp.]